ncbi:hypothetical protein [Tunicatimonas pelagia]|uniref:hypothetical protein n=1 Tax=Tunicatimonas pelagia TaxID=931531 RepID=UPI0026661CD9|nr:hypothetical protein [Tunicatimonas pelagia]WKN46307.1 hypothetical protein P0M28_15265 [Tunicatimonas pelagia]
MSLRTILPVILRSIFPPFLKEAAVERDRGIFPYRTPPLPKIIIATSVLFYSLLILSATLPVQAQEKIQVVTKTIQKQIPWKEAQKIVFNTEKATIDVKGWARDELNITIKLIAKHPKRSIAEQDLSVLQYAINTETDQIELTNFFRIQGGIPKIRSNLQTVYEVRVPQTSQLFINNRFGNISLSDLQGDATVTASFGEVQLNSVRANIELEVDYGDILMEKIEGSITTNTKKTNITAYSLVGSLAITCTYGEVNIKQVSGTTIIDANKTTIIGHGLVGDLIISSSYGEVDISTGDKLTAVTIDASRTNISFATSDPMHYYYNLEAFAGRVHTTFPGKRSENNLFMGKDTFQSYERQENQPIVSIKNSYSPITIKTLEKNETNTTRSAHRP